eukprot:3772648-Pleurochrysis_carterae.AAC.5
MAYEQLRDGELSSTPGVVSTGKAEETHSEADGWFCSQGRTVSQSCRTFSVHASCERSVLFSSLRTRVACFTFIFLRLRFFDATLSKLRNTTPTSLALCLLTVKRFN